MAEATDFGILGDVSRYVTGALSDTGKAALSMAGNLLSGSNQLSDYSEALALNGKVFKELSTVVRGLVKFAEGSLEEYQSLSGIGASFGAQMTEIKMTAAELGLTVEQMTELFNNNAEGLSAFGGTVEQSVSRFRAFSSSILDSNVGTNLRRMGYTVEDINDSLLTYQELFMQDGRGRDMTEAQQQAAVLELVTSIDELTKLTGKQRKEIEEDMLARRRQGDMQAYLMGLSDEQAAAVQAQVSQIEQTLGSTAADAFIDVMLRGAPVTEQTMNYMANMGPAAENFYNAANQLNAGNIGAFNSAVDGSITGMMDMMDTEDFRNRAILGGMSDISEAAGQVYTDTYNFRNRLEDIMATNPGMTYNEALAEARRQAASEQDAQVTDDDADTNLLKETIALQENLREVTIATQAAALRSLEAAGVRALNEVRNSMPSSEEISNIVSNTVDSIFDLAQNGIYDTDFNGANFNNPTGTGDGELTPGDTAGLGTTPSGTPGDPVSVVDDTTPDNDPNASLQSTLTELSNREQSLLQAIAEAIRIGDTDALNELTASLTDVGDAIDATEAVLADTEATNEEMSTTLASASNVLASTEDQVNLNAESQREETERAAAADNLTADELDLTQDQVNEARDTLQQRLQEAEAERDRLATEVENGNEVAASEFDTIQTTLNDLRNAINAMDRGNMQPATSLGLFDEGGAIPRGGLGIVGEFGPELVGGPANVVSRKDTSQLLTSLMSNVSRLMDIPSAIEQNQTAARNNDAEIISSSSDNTIQALGSLFSKLEGKIDRLIQIESRAAETGNKQYRATKGLSGNLHKGLG